MIRFMPIEMTEVAMHYRNQASHLPDFSASRVPLPPLYALGLIRFLQQVAELLRLEFVVESVDRYRESSPLPGAVARACDLVRLKLDERLVQVVRLLEGFGNHEKVVLLDAEFVPSLRNAAWCPPDANGILGPPRKQAAIKLLTRSCLHQIGRKHAMPLVEQIERRFLEALLLAEHHEPDPVMRALIEQLKPLRRDNSHKTKTWAARAAAPPPPPPRPPLPPPPPPPSYESLALTSNDRIDRECEVCSGHLARPRRVAFGGNGVCADCHDVLPCETDAGIVTSKVFACFETMVMTYYLADSNGALVV